MPDLPNLASLNYILPPRHRLGCRGQIRIRVNIQIICVFEDRRLADNFGTSREVKEGEPQLIVFGSVH